MKGESRLRCKPTGSPSRTAISAARSLSAMKTIAVVLVILPAANDAAIASVVAASRPQSSAFTISNRGSVR